MAIYHFNAKIIGRSSGKSAVASAAYRRAAKFFDERENKTWNYQRKDHVVHKEMLLPAHSPAWLINLVGMNSDLASEKLWNIVESIEKRIDSQLAREVEFSLPIELTLDQNIQLAKEFIQEQFVARGMIADWSVHAEQGNPHVHVMLSMRSLSSEGFGKKVIEWNSKPLLKLWREKWADYANHHLRLHQHEGILDHRSYLEQGIDLIPTIHLGKAVSDMDKRGLKLDLIKEAKQISLLNLTRIIKDPNILLDKMAKQGNVFNLETVSNEVGRYINDRQKFKFAANEGKGQITDAYLTPEKIAALFSRIENHDAVFTEREIAKALMPYTSHAEEFTQALQQILASPELLSLGLGDDGRTCFTTRKMFAIENDIQDIADKLKVKGHQSISERTFNFVLQQYEVKAGKSLTLEQVTAVKHITQVNAITCLVGRAGTGKSFSLGAARALWESNGSRVLGITLSGIAADGLSKEANIPSRTIQSFRQALDHGSLSLKKTDVIVMDEAGMTDSIAMHAVLKAVEQAEAKLVLVGDHAQLQPVGPGATFRALIERIGCAEITTIYRQKRAWQQEATAAFALGKVNEALDYYHQHGCIHLEKNQDEAIAQLVGAWNKKRQQTQHTLNEYLVIAHRNQDVNLLNQTLRQERMNQGEIAEGYEVNTSSGALNVSIGDRLLFTKNNAELGVKNGRFGTLLEVNFNESGNIQHLIVQLDGDDKKIIQVNPETYQHFTLGYAATVHKVQGVTVNHAFVYADGWNWNKNLAYVAMTRHRFSCSLFASQTTYDDIAKLITNLNRLALKDSLLDFPVAFAERRGIKTETNASTIMHKALEKLISMKQTLCERFEEWISPETYQQKKLDKLLQEETLAILQNRREDATHVAAYIDANKAVGLAWKAVKDHSDPHNKTTSLRQLLKEAGLKRNALAYRIVNNLDRYKLALERTNINISKLRQQATFHANQFETKQTITTPLRDLLHDYINHEVTQTEIVTAMNTHRGQNAEAFQQSLAKAKLNQQAKNNIITTICQHPEFKASFSNLKNASDLQDKVDSFAALQQRFDQGLETKGDIQHLIKLIGSKIKFTQSRDRSRSH